MCSVHVLVTRTCTFWLFSSCLCFLPLGKMHAVFQAVFCLKTFQEGCCLLGMFWLGGTSPWHGHTVKVLRVRVSHSAFTMLNSRVPRPPMVSSCSQENTSTHLKIWAASVRLPDVSLEVQAAKTTDTIPIVAKPQLWARVRLGLLLVSAPWCWLPLFWHLWLPGLQGPVDSDPRSGW